MMHLIFKIALYSILTIALVSIIVGCVGLLYYLYADL